jgi:hypothetical protein
MKFKQRDNEILSLSFLDCVCCGFGAMILLLMAAMVRTPQGYQESVDEASARSTKLRQELQEVQLLTRAAQTRDARTSGPAELDIQNQELRAELAALRARAQDAQESEARSIEREAQLLRVEPEPPTELPPRKRVRPVGGIPADSEYVIFVIDTSGSMQQFAWKSVLSKVEESLDVYPRLRGLQILSDEGAYMFPQFQGQWIPDTPDRRKAVLDTLRGWKPFSNSSPVEGIQTAIRAFYRPDRQISIYVLGDDYSGDSLAKVIREVDAINREADDGDRRVRIHAIGFPVQYTKTEVTRSGYRFAHLMRILCERNGGAFVGLPTLRVSGSGPAPARSDEKGGNPS